MKKVIIILSAVIVLIISVIVGIVIWNMPKEVKMYTVDPGDFFITNVEDSRCLIKADIIIETSNKKTMEFLTKNDFKLRDTVIKSLRSKDYNEIMKPDIQSVIESDIIQDLSATYELEGVEHIYFNEFVVQQ